MTLGLFYIWYGTDLACFFEKIYTIKDDPGEYLVVKLGNIFLKSG